MSPSPFTNRVVRELAEEDRRDPKGDPVLVHHTARTIDGLSDEGLDRIQVWVQSLARRHPLDGPLFAAHRELIQSLADDLTAEIQRRSRNGTS